MHIRMRRYEVDVGGGGAAGDGLGGLGGGGAGGLGGPAGGPAADAPGGGRLNVAGVKQMWGTEGYKGDAAAAAGKAAADAAAPGVKVPPRADLAPIKRPWDFKEPGAAAASASAADAPAPEAAHDPSPPPVAGRAGSHRASVSREPEVPPEPTERQKLAQSIFGGMGGPATAGRGAAAAPAVRRPPAGSGAAAAPAPAVAAAPRGRPGAAPAAPASSGVMDDLLGLMGPPAPAPGPAPTSGGRGTPAQRPSASSGMDDIFGSMTVAPVGTPTAAPARLAAAPDLFGADPFAPVPAARPRADVTALRIPSAIAAAAAGRLTSEAPVRAGGDANVAVGAYRVHGDDATKIVLFVLNTSAAPIANVAVRIGVPPFLKIMVLTGSPIPTPAGPNAVAFGVIGPASSVRGAAAAALARACAGC